MPPSHEAEGSQVPHQSQHQGPKDSRISLRDVTKQQWSAKRLRRRAEVSAAGTLVLMQTIVGAAAVPLPVTTSAGTGTTKAQTRYDRMALLPARNEVPSRQRDESSRGTQLLHHDSLLDADVVALAENLQHIEDVWKSGRFETHVDSDSREEGQVLDHLALTSDLSRTSLAKGKGRAREPTSPYVYNLEALHDVPLRKAEKSKSTMRLTSQRSPFHSSEVGRLASQHPNPKSVGLFRPDYPFVPSGRRRPKPSLFNSTNKAGVYDYRKGAAQHGSLYTLPPDVTHGNVFKYGWTSTMLDDDARLSVPDEYRQPRHETALAFAKRIAGMRWYRWKPGEGYVLCARKDYSAYEQGPGVALGQLLPPREHPYTSHLPMIPNDAKRDLVWMVFWCILLVGFLTFGSELRAFWRSKRKGKQRQINVPLIRILHEERASNSSAVVQGSIGLRSRQRSKARSIREMCKAALDSPFTRMRPRDTPSTLGKGLSVRNRSIKASRQGGRGGFEGQQGQRKASVQARGTLSKIMPGPSSSSKAYVQAKERTSSEVEVSEHELTLEDGILRSNGKGSASLYASPCKLSSEQDSDHTQLVFASGIESSTMTAGNRSSGSSSSTSTSTMSTSDSSAPSHGPSSVDIYTESESGRGTVSRIISNQRYRSGGAICKDVPGIHKAIFANNLEQK